VYLDHFNLAEEPFSVTSDPRFLYLSQSHEEALAHLEYCVSQRKGFAAITGEVGTGKTTLLNTLITKLTEVHAVAFVYRSASSTEELMRYVFKDLHLESPATDRATYLNMFNDYLLQQMQAGREVVLIIDEGQNLPIPVLEDLRLISNFEVPGRKLVQIILAGQSELGDKLRSPELRQLNQRIAIQFQLRALTLAETGHYIQHRLKVANARALDIFRSSAVKAVFQASGGVPRLINQICDTAMVRAAYQRKSTVDAAMVKAVMKEDFQFRSSAAGPEQKGKTLQWLLAAALVLALGAGGAGWLLGRRDVGPQAGPVLAQSSVPAPTVDGEAAADSALQKKPVADGSSLSPGVIDTPAATETQQARGTSSGKVDFDKLSRDRVKVRSGDSLVELARRRYGFSSWELVKALQDVNPQIINPNHIMVGDDIVLPDFSDSTLRRMRGSETF